MESWLSQLNSVPGVVGSMACDTQGAVVARAFPAGFGDDVLAKAGALLSNRTTALEGALGRVGTIDLRCASGRLVVMATPRARLLLLCAPWVNLQLLAMSVEGVVRGLQAPVAPAVPVAPAATGGGALYAAVRRVNAAIERSAGDPIRLRGQIAMKAGFSLDLVDADSPDDPAMLEALTAAAVAVLGKGF